MFWWTNWDQSTNYRVLGGVIESDWWCKELLLGEDTARFHSQRCVCILSSDDRVCITFSSIPIDLLVEKLIRQVSKLKETSWVY